MHFFRVKYYELSYLSFCDTPLWEGVYQGELLSLEDTRIFTVLKGDETFASFLFKVKFN